MTDSLSSHTGLDYGLDNSFAACYARLIEFHESDLRGFFRRRRTRTEIDLAAQISMEFD